MKEEGGKAVATIRDQLRAVEEREDYAHADSSMFQSASDLLRATQRLSSRAPKAILPSRTYTRKFWCVWLRFFLIRVVRLGRTELSDLKRTPLGGVPYK